MTVIAKMSLVSDPRQYGSSQLVELSCVCDNELMSQHTPANENRTFNQASPTGDVRMNVDPELIFRQQEEFYLIFVRSDTAPAFPDALVRVEARCVSLTDYGGTSRRVEVASQYRDYRETKTDPRLADHFSLRMMIDNPAASVQFQPGATDYHIGIYRASEMSMQEALRLAV